MKADHKRRSWSKRATSSAALAALALVLTSCGGDTADGDTGGEAQGFEFGAPQDEVNAAIEQLEPVTVTYQIPETSEQSPQANLGTHYKEAVEERSNGQITVELA